MPEIRPDLEAGKSAIEVRRCPLCEVLLGLLAEHPTPRTKPDIIAQDLLIALALVERAERDQAESARDRRDYRLHGDIGLV